MHSFVNISISIYLASEISLCRYLLSSQDDWHHALWFGGLGALVNQD